MCWWRNSYFLALNKELSKSNLLKEKKIDLIDFENCLFDIEERYELSNSKKDVIANLKQIGINKQSLGCDLETSYYNLLDN